MTFSMAAEIAAVTHAVFDILRPPADEAVATLTAAPVEPASAPAAPDPAPMSSPTPVAARIPVSAPAPIVVSMPHPAPAPLVPASAAVPAALGPIPVAVHDVASAQTDSTPDVSPAHLVRSSDALAILDEISFLDG